MAVIHQNLRCPQCGRGNVAVEPWGGDDMKLMCELKCGFIMLTDKATFHRYNYSDKIPNGDWLKISNRGLAR